MYLEPAWFVILYRLSIQYIYTCICFSCTALSFFCVILLFIGFNNCRKYYDSFFFLFLVFYGFRYRPHHRWYHVTSHWFTGDKEVHSEDVSLCTSATVVVVDDVSHWCKELSSFTFWHHACVSCCKIRAVCVSVFIYMMVALVCDVRF